MLTALCAMALQNGASEVAAVSAGPPGETDLRRLRRFQRRRSSPSPVTAAPPSRPAVPKHQRGLRSRTGTHRRRFLEMGDGLRNGPPPSRTSGCCSGLPAGETNGGETQPGCFLAAALLARLSAGSGPAEPSGGKALEGRPSCRPSDRGTD